MSFFTLSKRYFFTVSIGVSCAKEKTSIMNWIKEADEMLYEVKRNGKNGFRMQNNK
ncbi:MASE2 domain/diguanylate cyclase [Klebsiella variicola]|nr:MASE2 domain/diguanylate cyclase [Klebsiella variicola]